MMVSPPSRIPWRKTGRNFFGIDGQVQFGEVYSETQKHKNTTRNSQRITEHFNCFVIIVFGVNFF
jgi:hypothetical protein